MIENWDVFPVNIAETLGTIERKSFDFEYARTEVWRDGSSIFSGNTRGKISTTLKFDTLIVTLNDSSLYPYIVKNFSFKEISTNKDRILWSNDIFNQGGLGSRNSPDISSLFYRNGVLSKVSFTIHDSNILLEFYKNEMQQINRMTRIEELAKQGVRLYELNSKSPECRNTLVQLYKELLNDIKSIENIKSCDSLGKCLLYLTDFSFGDEEVYQTMAMLSYYFLSKDVEANPSNPSSRVSRVILLKMASKKDYLSNLMNEVLDLPKVSMWSPIAQVNPLTIRDSIYKMEIADIEELTQKGISLPFLQSSRSEYSNLISNGRFKPLNSLDKVVASGLEIHKKLYAHICQQVINKMTA